MLFFFFGFFSHRRSRFVAIQHCFFWFFSHFCIEQLNLLTHVDDSMDSSQFVQFSRASKPAGFTKIGAFFGRSLIPHLSKRSQKATILTTGSYDCALDHVNLEILVYTLCVYIYTYGKWKLCSLLHTHYSGDKLRSALKAKQTVPQLPGSTSLEAKKSGGDAATGDVVVFFDCHVSPRHPA